MTAGEQQAWAKGDRVTHASKPEWGIGEVQSASWTTHEGAKCQRLAIRFEKAGLKNLSTAFATLKDAGGGRKIDEAMTPGRGALLRMTPQPHLITKRPPGATGDNDTEAPPDPRDNMDPAKAREVMTRLPDDARDAFLPLDRRFGATLEAYLNDPSGGKLLDWATAQSGLADPMSLFSRHEIEQLYEVFRVRLDQHLQTLLEEARRTRTDLKPAADAAPPQGARALRRVNFGR